VSAAAELKAAIRSIPDYPKKGIVFRDLTTIWKDGKLMKMTPVKRGCDCGKALAGARLSAK